MASAYMAFYYGKDNTHPLSMDLAFVSIAELESVVARCKKEVASISKWELTVILLTHALAKGSGTTAFSDKEIGETARSIVGTKSGQYDRAQDTYEHFFNSTQLAWISRLCNVPLEQVALIATKHDPLKNRKSQFILDVLLKDRRISKQLYEKLKVLFGL